MYDMYRWNQSAGSGDQATRPAAAEPPGRAGRPPAEAARAVQEALDRRDNGGASAASPDQ